ncbi:tryptophan 7-halogenase [Myxococcaceae bacterium GXIMD 01537]
MTSSQLRFRRAVVIGSSMTGLMNARVLSEHFEQVVVLERDVLPNGPEPRKGVPQGRHIHVVLESGKKVLESLFPGLFQQMRQEGAEVIDMGRDFAWHHFGVWRPRYMSGIEMVLCTRVFLDWHVLRRVRELPNVTLREGCSVEGLLTDASGGRVTGVRVTGPEGAELLEADLVVDASGRGSHVPRWLEALGHGRPEEEQVGIDLAYTTRLYERPESEVGAWKMLIEYPRPPDSCRSGFISHVEGGRWIVSLNSYFGDSAPRDDASFLEFARSLPRPELYEALRKARPLTEPVTHRIPSSRWLHYERMEHLPDGLAITGDSVCSFNPIFAQGISVASKGVQLLAECLREHAARSPGDIRGLSVRFQRRLPDVIRVPWFLATTLDLQYPQARGTRVFGLGLLQWYVARFMEATSLEPRLYHQLNQVLHLKSGLGALLQPSVALRVLAYGLKSFFVPLSRRANVDIFPPPPEHALPPGRELLKAV